MSGAETGLLAAGTHAPDGRGPRAIPLQPAASEAAIRSELARVTSSSNFDASERNRRFLRHVVEETLAGRADRIKAYSIATTVFGRGVDFDPQNDPVVRMEAQRLRRALERFYLTEGRGSVVRILLPKGGYVPEFRNAGPSRAVDTDGSAAPADGVAALRICPFGVEADDSGCPSAETGLRYQIMIALLHARQLQVLGPSSASTEPDGAMRAEARADLVLTGSWAIAAGTLYVKAVLLDAGSGRLVWGQHFERALGPDGGVFGRRDEIANSIARAVRGVVARTGRERASSFKGEGGIQQG